jgi:hypothetical protein
MRIIADLDGTIADATHRLHHITKPEKDWDSFFAEVGGDEPIYPIIALLGVMSEAGVKIDIVTGRSAVAMRDTIRWLERNSVPCDRLHMRKEGDRRPDHVVKKEWLDANGTDGILFVLEDRARVVKMWRDAGLRALQVADGEF